MFNNVYMAMFDIDGTIKDLVKENNSALLRTMEYFGQSNLKLRGKIVIAINKISMYLVKTGLLPTNNLMHKILIFIYSVLLFRKHHLFRKKYFEEYNKQNIFFDDAEQMIQQQYNNGKCIYMVTKNVQNKNLLSYENESKYGSLMQYVVTIITDDKKRIKYKMYKTFINNSCFNNKDFIIIGDNFWDDVLPAMLLGTKVIWCNKYNSRIKALAIKIVKCFNKNVLSDN